VSVYEYDTIRIERAGWPRLREAIHGPVDDATHAAGGALVGLFAGTIGFASDEGVVLRAWPDESAMADHAANTLAATDVIESCDRLGLIATRRPTEATSLRTPGVYAHRWFWINEDDWEEFARLSEEGIWPYFESDGCSIAGLWRTRDQGRLQVLLLTRYASVAHWERTRLQGDVPTGADAGLYRRAQEAGRRRAELAERSIVRLTRLVLP
jgi:hypothetical protein